MKAKQKKQPDIQMVLNLSILVFSVIAILEYYLKDQATSLLVMEDILFVLVAILIFVVIYALWLLSKRVLKSHSQLIRVLNIVIYFVITAATIAMTGGCESKYKYLLLLTIISSTIEGNIQMGVAVSGISATYLFTIDLFFNEYVSLHSYANPAFENDIILTCFFFLLTYAIGYCISTKQQHINSLTNLVSVDELTKLYNYRYFSESLINEFEKAREEDQPLSLAIIDIDCFKSYNDIFGHDQANEVLRATGAMFGEQFPENFICSRYGGDEFSIIMPNTDAVTAYELLEKFRKRFGDHEFKGQKYLSQGRLTMSIGVAEVGKKTSDAKTLIRNADAALYRAKYLKKNRTEIFTTFTDEFVQYSGELDNKEFLTTVKTLIAVINSKDKHTYIHSDRVYHYAQLFADYLKLPCEQKRALVAASYMHDIGKINIPQDILLKTGPLTDEETAQMQLHPDCGADIVAATPSLKEESEVIREHHENYDGSGYPRHLKGDKIHYLARILKLIDTYDRMMSNQCTIEEAKREIQQGKGTLFDPQIADKFLDFIDILQTK